MPATPMITFMTKFATKQIGGHRGRPLDVACWPTSGWAEIVPSCRDSDFLHVVVSLFAFFAITLPYRYLCFFGFHPPKLIVPVCEMSASLIIRWISGVQPPALNEFSPISDHLRFRPQL
jgi:hypothetical protein